MTILVIEDNPEIAAFFAEALGAAGYEVELATSGAALPRLVNGCELALMDLSLPDLNGVEVAAQARPGLHDADHRGLGRDGAH
jgi:DNA-binding response OmpR family regulator